MFAFITVKMSEQIWNAFLKAAAIAQRIIGATRLKEGNSYQLCAFFSEINIY